MGTLWLPHGIHFCVASGHGVFLDLNTDAYSAVPLASSCLERVGEDVEGALSEALTPHADELVGAGLLSRSAAGCSSIAGFLAIPRVGTHILDPVDIRLFGIGREIWNGHRLSVRDGIGVLRACRWASETLAKMHISDIVDKVRAMKGGPDANSAPVDLRTALLAFGRMRPWFPHGYVCLHDSLALMRFLARRGLPADLVFAVRAQPFSAHCWVQTGGFVVNEDTEFANTFVPILRVGMN